MKKSAQIENEIPGMSVQPLTAHERTTGNEMKIKLPVKLPIALNRSFKRKKSPMTPIVNITALTMKIAFIETYPILKKREVKNGSRGER